MARWLAELTMVTNRAAEEVVPKEFRWFSTLHSIPYFSYKKTSLKHNYVLQRELSGCEAYGDEQKESAK